MSVAFVLMGFMTIIGPKLWRGAIAGWWPCWLMAATMAAQAAGAALLLVSRSSAVVLMSVVVFGSAFLLTPAIVPMTIRAVRPKELWASTIGAVTIFFALAQAVSPWISGVLIDRLGVRAGPAWTLGFSLLGAAIAMSGRRTSSVTRRA